MTGSLTHLGGERYKVRIYAGIDPVTGKQRLRSRTFRAGGAREAARLADGIAHQLRQEVDAVKAEKGTVAEAVHAWLSHQEMTASVTTLRRVRFITDRILADLGTIPLAKLTARQIDQWYATLRVEDINADKRAKQPTAKARELVPVKRRSEATLHHHHRILHGILRQAEKWDMVDRVATAKATPPKRSKKRPSYPAATALLKVLSDARPTLRFAAAFAAWTGMRRGELLGLRWSDIDGNVLRVRRTIVEGPGNTLEVRQRTKTEEDGRRVILGPQMLEALAAHRAFLDERARSLGGALSPDAYIICRPTRRSVDGTTPSRPGWLTSAWADQCQRHGVKIRFHDLRHFHASVLIEQGVPVTAVAERLGHAQVSTTLNVYAHSSRSAGEQAALVADGLLLPAPT